MPYNSTSGAYERRSTTVIDATPDGDTVAVAIDVKLDQGIDDYVVDLNHHKTNGNHYPATSTHTDSRFLGQSPAGVVEWKDGVPAADAALKDFSNVASGAIAPAKIAQDASNRFTTDAEKSTWNGLASETVIGRVELATTVEAAAGVDTSRAVTSAGVLAATKAHLNADGNAPIFACRAWVTFDGVATPPVINGSGNISSVVRNGTGDYTVNFTTAMKDEKWCPVYSGYPFRIYPNGIQGAAAFRFLSTDTAGNPTNYSSISIAIFR